MHMYGKSLSCTETATSVEIFENINYFSFICFYWIVPGFYSLSKPSKVQG